MNFLVALTINISIGILLSVWPILILASATEYSKDVRKQAIEMMVYGLASGIGVTLVAAQLCSHFKWFQRCLWQLVAEEGDPPWQSETEDETEDRREHERVFIRHGDLAYWA